MISLVMEAHVPDQLPPETPTSVEGVTSESVDDYKSNNTPTHHAIYTDYPELYQSQYTKITSINCFRVIYVHAIENVRKSRVEYDRDPNKWMEWYNLLRSDESDNDDESDHDEEDHIKENLYDSNSEQEEAGDVQNEVIDRDMPCFTGKNGTTQWAKHLRRPPNVTTPACNVIVHLPRPNNKARET
ncbi:hypothetical protein QE152_g33994 [Popillia japonica]|uniref:Uncharacterized protein n=1 Tax=Popillia japonica TaxID=7064 RepID=A0AAW1IV77_POPJA